MDTKDEAHFKQWEGEFEPELPEEAWWDLSVPPQFQLGYFWFFMPAQYTMAIWRMMKRLGQWVGRRTKQFRDDQQPKRIDKLSIAQMNRYMKERERRELEATLLLTPDDEAPDSPQTLNARQQRRFFTLTVGGIFIGACIVACGSSMVHR